MKASFSKSYQNYKGKMIVVLILWLALTILFVSPLAIGLEDGNVRGRLDFGEAFVSIFNHVPQVGASTIKALSTDVYRASFLKTFVGFTIIYALVAVIGIINTRPKHEYEDIEHGSSDWCTEKEKYSVLSRDHGIILAENTRLPVDKRGNVNILVVGGSGSRKVCILRYTQCISMFGFVCFY
jgi:hypothetical protein